MDKKEQDVEAILNAILEIERVIFSKLPFRKTGRIMNPIWRVEGTLLYLFCQMICD